MPAHVETCGKAALTCTDCQAHYLREDQASHSASCPEKPATCPFASHGCSALLVRKDYDQHQIDCATKHSELVAGKLSAVDKRMADMTVEIADLKKTAANNSIAQITEELASIKEAQTDLVASLSTATVNVTWCIDNAAKRLASNDIISSKKFNVRNTQGDSVLTLECEFKPRDVVTFFTHKAFSKSSNQGPIYIGGTEVTLQHPTDSTEHASKVYGDQAILSESGFPGWGWAVFVADVKPYIAADDSITFTCKVKYQMNNSVDDVIMV